MCLRTKMYWRAKNVYATRTATGCGCAQKNLVRTGLVLGLAPPNEREYIENLKKRLWICYHMAAMCSNNLSSITYGKITVAARSKARNVFASSNTGVVGSSPTQGMDVCVRLFCICVRSRPCDGLIPRPRSPTDCRRLRNRSETKRFTEALFSKWEQKEYKDKKKKNNIRTFKFKLLNKFVTEDYCLLRCVVALFG
jgi:hypothetical protein